jgi:hypothetical protein
VVVILGEDPAEACVHAKFAEEIVRDAVCMDSLRAGAAFQGNGVLELANGVQQGSGMAAELAIHSIVEVWIGRKLGTDLEELDEILRIADRKRAQQYRIDEREDLCVGGDSESDKQDRYGKESWISTELAGSIAKVLAHRVIITGVNEKTSG